MTNVVNFLNGARRNMKSIQNGMTYNTDTSTKLAQDVFEDEDGEDTVGVLYQNRNGAYFVHYETTSEVYNHKTGGRTTRITNEIQPKSQAEAEKWLLDGVTEVFHNPFGDPDEASAELDDGKTILVRMPSSLKGRIEEAAANEKVSCNSWAMRCFEKCL